MYNIVLIFLHPT